ncbi:uncharacterized protein F5Z01DRAFT_510934 [Emericellopsis atlantica]|uniref:Uncharacterized protein n=1 Tax=Emericellopsis atlantica TaxID=2614577 RepID=A0A9P7ZQJ5_9HYPO|nr:uncharacterized protein F5Z01DRAFT_510934 [Emericellopsis atlantica]KAG9256463.1 hypothetical protein F5Z01DRAFT_510934 [Emericellopsis atlantica]
MTEKKTTARMMNALSQATERPHFQRLPACLPACHATRHGPCLILPSEHTWACEPERFASAGLWREAMARVSGRTRVSLLTRSPWRDVYMCRYTHSYTWFPCFVFFSFTVSLINMDCEARDSAGGRINTSGPLADGERTRKKLLYFSCEMEWWARSGSRRLGCVFPS